MKKQLFLLPLALGAFTVIAPGQATDDLFPPNAKPGQCYARVFVPAAYETRSESVLRHAGYEKLQVTPARFEMAEERVLVKEASERIEIIPATYEWVEERKLVKQASKKLVTVPAQFETVTEEVLDKPAETIWKRGRGPIEKLNNGTGEIMCLVEVPATYKTVTRQVVRSEATTKEVEIPAEYKTVRRQVVKTPPSTRKVVIPAEHQTLKVMRAVSEPKIERSSVPAQNQTVTKTVRTSEGHMAWRQILCETNMSKELVYDLQNRLRDGKYYAGPVDGVIGQQTVAALRSFQRDKGIAEGQLTIAALEKLGVSLARN